MHGQWSTRERKLIVIIVVLSILLISMLFSAWMKKEDSVKREFSRQSFEDSKDEQEEETVPAVTTIVQEEKAERGKSTESVMVDIKGAVDNPYVYDMNEEERVIDAISRAGGLLEEASTKHINLAQKVFDGMVIYIPTEEEVLAGGEEQPVFDTSALNVILGHTQDNSSSTGKININTATATELESLPGIGPSRAQAIITYREEKGAYTTPEDLMNVSGIGTKIFANLKNEIEVR